MKYELSYKNFLRFGIKQKENNKKWVTPTANLKHNWVHPEKGCTAKDHNDYTWIPYQIQCM